MLHVALKLRILGISYLVQGSSLLREGGGGSLVNAWHTCTRFRREAPQIHSFDADVGLLPKWESVFLLAFCPCCSRVGRRHQRAGLYDFAVVGGGLNGPVYVGNLQLR